jgi:hypothetical protein
MRLGYAIFFASTAGLLTLAAPTLAGNANAHKVDEQSASPSCHAYQRAADGSWEQLPCQEMGSAGRTQRRSARSTDEETR